MVTIIQAQEKKTDDGFKMHHFGKMHRGKEMADLNLSDEQKAQLKSLNESYHSQVADLEKQDNITVKESREKMQTLRKDHYTKVQSILTTEQKEKIAKNKEDRKTRMKAMSEKREQHTKEWLNLSDEQSKKLSDNRKAAFEKIRAIQENSSLNDEQKKEQTKAVMKEQKENMKSILTAEQLQKMKEGWKHHGKKKQTPAT
jgi:Spy/CpxP family protein refolding chaperone